MDYALRPFEEDSIHFRRGALLQDIGKMGIPDAILLKPERLTTEEREIIQQAIFPHPTIHPANVSELY